MKQWLSLDLRALAVLRMGYGFVILLDLGIRATDLIAHYTDWGAMPREAVLELGWQREYWSIHMANGTWPFQAFLFLIAAAAAACLFAGYHTRWASVISWMMLCSLHSRNPMILDGGDTYLRCLMFWCMWLPWGARWSIDAYRRKAGEEPPKTWLDVATLGYMMQIGIIYLMSAVLKTDPIWRTEFTAVYYALMIDQLSTPLAGLLLEHPQLMKTLTVATLAFEVIAPIALWTHPIVRGLAAVGLSCLHLGFGTFMHLGAFAVIGMLSPLGLWPSAFYDWFEKTRLFAWLRAKAELFAEWWPAPGSLDPNPRPLHVGLSGVLVALMGYVLWWNSTTIPGFRSPIMLAGWIGRALRIDQQWNMFAPKPLEEDGWYIIDAEKVNGEHIDLFRGGAPVSWDKPNYISSMYANARWRKFMMNLWSRDLSQWRLHYGRYLTRRWNESHSGPDQIRTFKIYFMLETTLPGGNTKPVEKVMLWHHFCFDMPKETPKKETPATPSPTPEPDEKKK